MQEKKDRFFFSILLFLLLLVSGVQAIDRNALEWNEKAEAFHGSGNYSGALAARNQALLIDGDFAAAWYGKGVELNALGRYREANDAFDQALLRNVNYAAAWNGKSVALYNLGRYKDALRACEYACSLDPHNAYAEENLRLLKEKTSGLERTTPARNSWDVQKAPVSTPAAATPATKPVTAATTKAASQKEMIYAAGVTPDPRTGPSKAPAASMNPGSALELASSPGDISSADAGAALDLLSSKNIIAAPTDNSTKNFLAAMDQVPEPESLSSRETTARSPPDIVSLLMSFIGLGFGLRLSP